MSDLTELMKRRPSRGKASSDFDLRARLKRLGIKQIHFADYIGRDHSGVRRWIKHKSAPGEIEMLLDLLDVHILSHEEPQWLKTMRERYSEGGQVDGSSEDDD